MLKPSRDSVMDDYDDLEVEEALSLKRAVPSTSSAVQHSFGRGKGGVGKLLSQLAFPLATTHNVHRNCGGGGGIVARNGSMRGVTAGGKPKISGRARVLMKGHVEERKPGMYRTTRVRGRVLMLCGVP